MKKILFVCLLTFVGLSCDKDEPQEEGAPIEKLAGMESKKWKLSSATAWSGALSLDLVQNSPNRCLGDNELTLRADGSYLLEDTGVRCSGVDKVEGQWLLNESPLQVSLDEISLMGRRFTDVVLDVTVLKNNSFSGTIHNVPENELNVNKIELVFTVME